MVDEQLTSADAEHTQYAGTTAHIENYFVLEQMLILLDGIHVSSGPHIVFQHFFVDSEMRIGVEIVIGAREILSSGGGGS